MLSERIHHGHNRVPFIVAEAEKGFSQNPVACVECQQSVAGLQCHFPVGNGNDPPEKLLHQLFSMHSNACNFTGFVRQQQGWARPQKYGLRY